MGSDILNLAPRLGEWQLATVMPEAGAIVLAYWRNGNCPVSRVVFRLGPSWFLSDNASAVAAPDAWAPIIYPVEDK
jgi:hypothetical protein